MSTIPAPASSPGQHAIERPWFLRRPISHIAYVVDNLSAAVESWVTVLGAGPFFVLDHIGFDSLHFQERSAPSERRATFDHSAAFGQWGSVAIELQQIHSVSPPGLGRRLSATSAPSVSHTAYISSDPDADRAELAQAGMPAYLYATTGPVDVSLHDVPWLGHSVEVHRDSDYIINLFSAVAWAARDWDGHAPLRHGAPHE